jgi:hypothetical protein
VEYSPFFKKISLSFSETTSNTEGVSATFYVITDFFDTIIDGAIDAKAGLYMDLGIQDVMSRRAS